MTSDPGSPDHGSSGKAPSAPGPPKTDTLRAVHPGSGSLPAGSTDTGGGFSPSVAGCSPPTSSTLSGQGIWWWGVLLFVLGGLIGAGVMRLTRTDAVAPGAQLSDAARAGYPVLGRISGFSLTERSGDPVSLDDLSGKVWVADFFFTACASICPMMSNRMAELQRQVLDNPQVKLVSISVDPERDTPARLRRYAEQYGADANRWWFLTGDKAAIYRLSRESFLLGVEEVPEPERTPDTEDVLHSSKFVLVDQEGRIRGYYDGEEPATVEMLAKDIAWLLKP